MIDGQELKKQAVEFIECNKEQFIGLGESIFQNPELGYKERKTGRLVADELAALGLHVERNLAVTGCKATAHGKEEGPIVGIMGELDAVLCREHPHAHPQTGAAHACGHHIQLAVMLGVAFGLVQSGVIDELAGAVSFLGVPAEEYIELDFRSQLKKRGEINFYGGKQELLQKGYLDDIDMAISIHASPELDPLGQKAVIGPRVMGFVGKNVQYTGKASHAGAAPEEGINALNAAMLGILNIHAQRDTFPNSESIRVHPIVTKGGDLVNTVPDDVRLETYVRGLSVEGIRNANQKVNRALKAGAMAVGAAIKIEDIPGYLPFVSAPDLNALFRENLSLFLTEKEIGEGGEGFPGSTDFGDISQIMPTLLCVFGGVLGGLHTKDFRLQDRELAYVIPAKAIALTIIDLLLPNTGKAQSIITSFRPVMSKADYFRFQGEMAKKIRFDGAD